MWVIKFQKRGLPHAHCLLILDPNDGPKSAEEFNQYVSAEIPDPDEYHELHELVLRYHTHVCGNRKKGQSCVKNGRCTKGFPKPYAKRTRKVENEYPVYMRRSPVVKFMMLMKVN